MKNHLIISESEKEKILSSHKSFMPKRYSVETSHLSFTEQFTFFQNELEFLKEVHLHRISMLQGINKNIYLRTVQNDYALGLFENNSNILERFGNQFLDILNESITDFANELDKLNSFIIESLKISLVEQSDFAMDRRANAMLYSTGIRDKKDYETVNRINTQAQQQMASTESLAKAVQHIKEKGIGYVMETLRDALFTGTGTAIQIALSFTGAGAVLVTIAWGILGLYDLYQVAINGNMGYLGNLLIDIICCVSAGVLAKPLSALAGRAFASVEVFVANLMKGSVGTAVKPFIQTIIGGFQTVMKWFGQAAKFMKDKMGIGWASNLISKLEPYYTKMVNWLSSSLKGSAQKVGSLVSSLISPAVLRTSAVLATRFEPAVFSRIAQLSEVQIGEYVGRELEKTTIKYIEKEANSKFKERPTEEFLKWVDSNFGTAYGDLYLAYISGKKMFRYNNEGKYLKVADVGANTARGEFDYAGAKASDIQKGTNAVVKKAGM